MKCAWTKAGRLGRVGTRRLTIVGALTALGLLIAEDASAQGGPPNTAGPSVSAGPGAVVVPDYPGAEGYRVLPIPAIDVRAGRLFVNSRDGVGVEIAGDRSDGWRIGIAAFFRPDRLERFDRDRLRGLGRISATPQLRGFVRRQLGAVELGVLGSRDLGGSDGTTVDLSAGYRLPLGRGFVVVGPTLSFADDRFARSWFGVSDAQAARGGRRAFAIGGGAYQATASAALVLPLSRRWALGGFGGYQRLLGDFAKSPVVARKGTPIGGISLSYRFR